MQVLASEEYRIGTTDLSNAEMRDVHEFEDLGRLENCRLKSSNQKSQISSVGKLRYLHSVPSFELQMSIGSDKLLELIRAGQTNRFDFSKVNTS